MIRFPHLKTLMHSWRFGKPAGALSSAELRYLPGSTRHLFRLLGFLR